MSRGDLPTLFSRRRALLADVGKEERTRYSAGAQSHSRTFHPGPLGTVVIGGVRVPPCPRWTRKGKPRWDVI